MHPRTELLAVKSDDDTLQDRDQGAYAGRSWPNIAVATVTGSAGIGDLVACSKCALSARPLEKGELANKEHFGTSLLGVRGLPTAQPSA